MTWNVGVNLQRTCNLKVKVNVNVKMNNNSQCANYNNITHPSFLTPSSLPSPTPHTQTHTHKHTHTQTQPHTHTHTKTHANKHKPAHTCHSLRPPSLPLAARGMDFQISEVKIQKENPMSCLTCEFVASTLQKSKKELTTALT